MVFLSKSSMGSGLASSLAMDSWISASVYCEVISLVFYGAFFDSSFYNTKIQCGNNQNNQNISNSFLMSASRTLICLLNFSSPNLVRGKNNKTSRSGTLC